MGRLPESFLDALRSGNDIVNVMSSYVEIKRAGRDYVCSCPFHSERTPSCHIYTETQSFYCFGCGAGGDVINFIRLIEQNAIGSPSGIAAARVTAKISSDMRKPRSRKAVISSKDMLYFFWSVKSVTTELRTPYFSPSDASVPSAARFSNCSLTAEVSSLPFANPTA